MEPMYHTQVTSQDIGKYILLPGDPGRVKTIAALLDNPNFVAQNREHTTFTGYLNGEKVSVVSTGMGAPSTAICVEELLKCGAHTFIRVGTAGAMQEGMKKGGIAIVTGAIRDEGTTPQYLPIEYPAIADFELVHHLQTAAEKLDFPFTLGVAHSKDSFFAEVEMDRMPIAPQLKQRWNAWVAGGAVASEMECSSLLILAQIHRVRASAVLFLLNDNDGREAKDFISDEKLKTRSIETAVEALRSLIVSDREKSKIYVKPPKLIH